MSNVDAPESIDQRALAGASKLSIAMAGVATVVGLVVLTGWMLGIAELQAAFSGGLIMKVNSALALAVGGLSSVLLCPPDVTAQRRLLGRALGAFLLVLGTAQLSQHLFGWDLGIDELLAREPHGAIATVSPGRMGPPASLCFALLGAALLAIGRTTRSGLATSQVLALAVATIALLPTLGYIAGASELYSLSRFTGIALPTAVSLIALAIAVFFARPTMRPAVLLVRADAGGYLARRLVPATVILPIALWLLRLFGEHQGVVEPHFGRALVLLSFILLFTVLIWVSALRLSEESNARDRAEQTSTELLQSERNARSDAERAAKLKDEFVATVSHELRTPLNAILGWASMVRLQRVKPEDIAHGLTVIERNAQLQARLIDDLLDISRIVSGKMHIDLQRIELCTVVRAAVSALAPLAEAKAIAIEQSCEPRRVPMRGDAARLQQVVGNLLSNAIKFTPKGGRIAVRVRVVDEVVQISVQDTGIGIGDQFLPLVFDRFRQADASSTRRYGGLGLGLSIARHLVDLHGGTLGVASDGADCGSTFTVALPLPADWHANKEPRTPQLDIGALGSSDFRRRLAGLRVLVVDDDNDARELVSRVLTECGASVETANGAERALAVIGAHRTQVLITDIGMPGTDGYALLRSVREQFQPSALPAIALTAFARPEDRARALDSGFQAHLAKPVDISALTQTVAALAAAADA